MVVAKAIKPRKRKRENEENTESKIIFQAKVKTVNQGHTDSDARSDRRDVSDQIK